MSTNVSMIHTFRGDLRPPVIDIICRIESNRNANMAIGTGYIAMEEANELMETMRAHAYQHPRYKYCVAKIKNAPILLLLVEWGPPIDEQNNCCCGFNGKWFGGHLT